jgi:hypothetical protein
MSFRTRTSINPSAPQRQPMGIQPMDTQPMGTQPIGNILPSRQSPLRKTYSLNSPDLSDRTPREDFIIYLIDTHSRGESLPSGALRMLQVHEQANVTTKTLADLMHAAAKKSRALSSPKSTAPLRSTVLQNRMVNIINAALVSRPLHITIGELDAEFISSHPIPRQRHVVVDAQEPSTKRTPVDDCYNEVLAEQYSSDYSEVLAEQYSSDYSEVLAEQYSSDFSEVLAEQYSSDYSEVLAEQTTHAEFPDDETMVAAFGAVHMAAPSDAIYMLPTQPGFDMSSSSQPFTEYDFGDIAMLNLEDELAFAQTADPQTADPQTADPQFETYLTAVIHASGLVHAMEGTTLTTEECMALYFLVSRAWNNTATDLDRVQIAFLISVLREDTVEKK